MGLVTSMEYNSIGVVCVCVCVCVCVYERERERMSENEYLELTVESIHLYVLVH